VREKGVAAPSYIWSEGGAADFMGGTKYGLRGRQRAVGGTGPPPGLPLRSGHAMPCLGRAKIRASCWADGLRLHAHI
jgi:hypothetical protein